MHYPFRKINLNYSFNALEPKLSEEIIRIHYDGHYQNYVNKLNAALEKYPFLHSWSIDELIYQVNIIPSEIRDDVWVNGGGVYNHAIYFASMTPNFTTVTDKFFLNAINQSFSSLDSFLSTFIKIAKSLTGSGYVWLVCDGVGKLSIITTINQNTTIPYNLYPLMTIDLWEHSYYLQYKNKRDDYIDAWIKLINFKEVERRYRDCFIKR